MTSPRRRAARGQGAVLGAEVLTAAMDLLRETGDADAVSLRKVAERVGVSVPSIYLHYADKQALLDAVCERVFDDLDVAMTKASADARDPFEALRAQGVAYVRFALDNPEHYRIALSNKHNDAADKQVAGGAFGHLIDTVEQCVQIGVLEGDSLVLGLQLWSATHGLASLMMDKPGMPWPDVPLLVDRTICATGIGLAVLARLPEDAFTDPPPVSELVALLETLRG